MSEPLNILYYNTFLPKNMGEGLVSRQFLTAAQLLDDWNLITVPPAFAAERNGKAPSAKKSVPARLKQFAPQPLRQSVQAVLSPISRWPLGPSLHRRRMSAQLAAALHQNEPFDLLLLHLSQGDLEVLAQLCRQTKLPVVIRVPAPLSYEAKHIQQRFISKRDQQNERFLYEKADAILVISEGMKQIFVEMGLAAQKIYSVPNGVDFNKFSSANKDGRAVRQRHGLVDKKVVGYVGSFWPGNDLITLLKAWQLVESQCSEAALLLVGYGAQFEPSQQLSARLGLKNCIWVGQVPHDRVPNYITAMDVAVGPYVKEAVRFVSPLKVIEYAALGRPVVATSGGQIKEIIEDGVTGYTYEAGSAEELADHILTLLANPEAAAEMGSQAKRLMEEWYSWDRIAAKVLQVCRDTAVNHAMK